MNRITPLLSCLLLGACNGTPATTSEMPLPAPSEATIAAVKDAATGAKATSKNYVLWMCYTEDQTSNPRMYMMVNTVDGSYRLFSTNGVYMGEGALSTKTDDGTDNSYFYSEILFENGNMTMAITKDDDYVYMTLQSKSSESTAVVSLVCR